MSPTKTPAPAAVAEPQGIAYGLEIPFVHLLGFRLIHWGEGLSKLQYQPEASHLNSFGVTHGGACMTLLDVAMAVAARSVNQTHGVVTIEMKTSFMQPAMPDRGPLTGEGRLIHRTRSTAFVEATLIDAQGHPCAHATGTFRYVPQGANLPHLPEATHGAKP